MITKTMSVAFAMYDHAWYQSDLLWSRIDGLQRAIIILQSEIERLLAESDRVRTEGRRVVLCAASELYGEGAVIDWAAQTARPKEA